MGELWRELGISDRVRVVEWPKVLHEDRLHPDTRDLYVWLIDTGKALTIGKIHGDGLPEGEIRRFVDGVEHHEFLLLNHSGLEIVAETDGTTLGRGL